MSANFEDSESEEVSDSDEDLEDVDDYEEGEIQSILNDDENMHVDDNPPVTVEVSLVCSEPTRVRQETPVNQEMIDINVALEKSARGFNDEMVVHGKGNSHAWEMSQARDNNNNRERDCGPGGLNDMKGDGPNEINSDVNNMGPNYPLGGGGPIPATNLGKRFRVDRSPPSIGSLHGPSQRVFGCQRSSRGCVSLSWSQQN
ncbi:hypothetical protein Hanom_Chr05g00401131 [Helianthus anomalus]